MTRISGQMRQTTTAEVRPDHGTAMGSGATRPSVTPFWLSADRLRSNFVAMAPQGAEDHVQRTGNPENVGLNICEPSHTLPSVSVAIILGVTNNFFTNF
jgi:hypothetical protein